MELKQIAPWNWFKREQEDAHDSRSLALSRHNAAYPTPLARFHEEFDNLFENMLRCFPLAMNTMPGRWPTSSNDLWMKPSVDIASTDKSYTISAELPGVDEKGIDVQLYGDTLVIRGKKEHEHKEKKDNYYCIERSYGSFQRQLSLPEDADADHIKANYKNGVLTLTVPRRAAAVQSSKHIEVNAA